MKKNNLKANQDKPSKGEFQKTSAGKKKLKKLSKKDAKLISGGSPGRYIWEIK